MSDRDDNICLDCGACCKSFRVSFYWAEALERGLPEGWTEQVTPHLSCMKGTNASAPYCAALGKGDAGAMACGVYAHRPGVCREVQVGDEKCCRAREKHGLAAIAGVGTCEQT
ncbi:YkgJ family cysteine cluster protein [Massilia sp. DD77]|uniref:YkgJ family cysteine cluster protein n=1 Tax=Massilia sp. DD77 TaxID=3109349 RepID=UPI003000DEA0